MSLKAQPSYSSDEVCGLCHYPAWQASQHEISQRGRIVEFSGEQMTKVAQNSGCTGCKIANKAWSFETTAGGEMPPEYMFLYKGDRIMFALHRGYYAIREIDVFTLPNQPRLGQIRQASLMPLDTRPASSLPLIRKWLSECSNGHSACSAISNYVPPRLLDLSFAKNAIRLVTAAEISSAGDDNAKNHDFRYACLSHCWGPTRPRHVLYKETERENSESIPLKELAATFQQAVEVCRALEIRYLWIDSLCIVQDSNSDWAHHVSEMREIYQHGYITLAAAASGDDEGGLYRENLTQMDTRYQLSLTEGGNNYELFFREWQNSGFDRSSTAPLLGRGWVVQERLLSRRFVCFGPLELIWECLETVSCSCTIEPYVPTPKGPEAFLNRRSFHDDLKVRMAGLDALSLAERYHEWRQVVTLYTSCALTKVGDKLPAITGLAKLFEQHLSDEFISGTWRKDLAKDIAWAVAARRPPSSHNRRLRQSPSWAWSSAEEGKVTYPRLSNTDTFSIQSVTLSRRGADLFDYLDAGLLTIRGILFPVTLSTDADSDHFKRFPSLLIGSFTVREGPMNQAQAPTSPDPSVSSSTTDGHIESGQGEFYADCQFWGESDDAFLRVPTPFAFFFLGMKSGRGRRGAGKAGQHFAQGLLLREVRDDDDSSVSVPGARKETGIAAESPKKYERVAALWYHTGHSFDQWAGSRVPKTTFVLA